MPQNSPRIPQTTAPTVNPAPTPLGSEPNLFEIDLDSETTKIPVKDLTILVAITTADPPELHHLPGGFWTTKSDLILPDRTPSWYVKWKEVYNLIQQGLLEEIKNNSADAWNPYRLTRKALNLLHSSKL